MPNGRGYPDCSYCAHYQSGLLAALLGRKPRCGLYQIDLRPLEPGWQYRLCASFAPTKRFHRDNIVPLEQRLARFPIKLEPQVLYAYKHHGEEHIRPWMSLQTGAAMK